ncbi:hypothetical protein OG394_34635 [Kribbella sp. NBC_01245]|uniref:hypothetical protein n=1 Tax=Kribbella sp. NBC_01245 TaxID=2903578 RepID=UPI002E27B6CC|nr:hypothetical protein [Kribbella sp. NBC_01245]
MKTLGIDIGRVIIDGGSHPNGGDTAFFNGDTATLLRTPAVAGAFDSIARLTTLFNHRVWLVSKAGPRVQQRSLDWLHHHDFFTHTGIPATNVRFCLRRADKAAHCAELAITHFVDDNLEVHQALAGLVPHRYLFGPQRHSNLPRDLVPTLTWPDAERAITQTIALSPVRP